ncbi:MAG: hypothetical protein D6799_00490, partial [Bacteroidetes bacterium]
PYFLSKNEDIEIKVGIKTTLDALYSSKFYFYPIFFGNYNLYKHIIEVFAGVDGGLYKNSIKSLSDENPFIVTTFYSSANRKQIHLTNSNQSINIYVGFKGRLSSQTDYIIQGNYQRWDSLYFFNPYFDKYTTLNNQYIIEYDNTSLYSLNAQLRYDANANIKISASGTYYYYRTKNLAKPYHKPLYKAQLTAEYLFNENLKFKLDGFLLGERWAKDFLYQLNVQNKLLPAIPDFNFTAEYKRNKKFSVFATLNNIANIRYYRWYNYPSQRFNLFIGFTYLPL